jgi:hypothetical protein
MRYRLRTLCWVVLSIGPLLLAGRELARMLPAYRAFEDATATVDLWRAELDKAYAMPINRRNLAGVRHASLTYQRADESSREKSVLYRVLVSPKQ